MCVFGPKPPSVPPPPAPPPTPVDDAVSRARLDQQRRARAAQGYSSTIAGSPLGDISLARTGRKTLLGE